MFERGRIVENYELFVDVLEAVDTHVDPARFLVRQAEVVIRGDMSSSDAVRVVATRRRHAARKGVVVVLVPSERPLIDGLLRALRPHVKVILMTGWADTIGADDARSRGADLVLAKPFPRETLYATLAALQETTPATTT